MVVAVCLFIFCLFFSENNISEDQIDSERLAFQSVAVSELEQSVDFRNRHIQAPYFYSTAKNQTLLNVIQLFIPIRTMQWILDFSVAIKTKFQVFFTVFP